MVLVVVVIVYANERRVFVSVGSVVTGVYLPAYTVNGGSVIVVVVGTTVDLVVVIGLPVKVIVAFTGIVGRSGPRLSN
jgi:hypothetical protein